MYKVCLQLSFSFYIYYSSASAHVPQCLQDVVRLLCNLQQYSNTTSIGNRAKENLLPECEENGCSQQLEGFCCNAYKAFKGLK